MSNNNNRREPNAAEQAREQAKAYSAVWAPRPFDLGDGESIEIPPHPNLRLLDDDRLEAYEALLYEIESYDRAPDVYVPEQKLENGTIIPEETIKGAVLIPHRRTTVGDDGVSRTELIHPPWAVRVVMACLGAEAYDRLKAAGKSASDVWRIWNEQGVELAEREKLDTKSFRGFNRVANVSSPTGG